MDADHTGHDRPKHKKPTYFYDTPFALIAFMLALLMIVPMSGRISPVPDARADGANGTCEIICPPPDGSIQVCNSDPADPDCNLTINTTCLCNDGNTFTITGSPSATTCNTDTTCNDHGGWAGAGGKCLCNDSYSFDSPFTPSSAACTPNPPTSPSCFDHGGWAGDPITIGGCAELEIFTRCTADAFVHDPSTGATLVNERLVSGEALGHLENQAIDEVIALHDLSTSTAERDRVLTWARDRVRAQIFAKLTTIIKKPAAERTAEEQTLYDWLTLIVWQKRIEPAQKAWEQFQAWQNAVEYATCSWQPPNSTYWQPKWQTAANDPQKISCEADVSLGGHPAQRLCQLNGCSLGKDGIPRTDPTPNSLGDPPNPNDDGEACFAAGNFAYDACTETRCAGFSPGPGCNVAIPAHPTYEQFKGYGATLANKEFVYQPSFISIIGNTGKYLAILGGLGIAAVAAAVAGGIVVAINAVAASAAATASLYSIALGGEAIAATVISIAGAVTSVFIVVLAVAIAILGGISVAEFAQLPGQLQTDVRTAASATNSAQGKPNLATLMTTDDGYQEIFLAFIKTVGPEIDLSGRTAPAPENSPLWVVRNAVETLLSNESGLDSTGNARLLQVSSWPDAEGNTNPPVQVGLFGGWFVKQVGSTRSLSLGLEYIKPNGEKWTAWRTKCMKAASSTATCTEGELLFIHTHNGDEKPTALSNEAFLAGFANVDSVLFYKNAAGETRMASFATAPTATGISSTGTTTEGQQFTFTGTASDSNGATVSFAWDFGDGSTATGSPVQHTFVDNGTFPVKVTPTNSFGLSGAPKTQSVDIANALPVVTAPAAPADKTVDEGELISFALGSFSDAGVSDKPWAVEVDWGDGSPHTTFNREAQGALPNTGHTYADGPNSYPVSVTVKDKDGGSGTKQTFTVIVNNVKPSGGLLLSTSSVPEGSSFSFSFFNILGLDPSSVDRQTLQYAFDCGAGLGADSSTNGVTCPTTDNGTRTIRGRIKDKDGGANEQSTTVEVTNVAPTATFTAPVQAFKGESAILAFSQQFDPSAADTTAGFTYAYNCTASGTLTVANNRAATATCKYLTTGTFTVGGTIKDKDQDATSYTASVTVISLEQALSDLRSQVVALNLNATRTSDLTTKIDNALQKLAQGQKAEANKQLQDFIKKVKDMIGQKVLTSAQGKALTDMANRIIASIAAS